LNYPRLLLYTIPVCHRAIICPIYYISITSLVILAGCFGSIKSSNDEAANQSVSGHTLRIFLYRSPRILFLFSLAIIIINIPNAQEKSKSLKNSIEYIVLSIELRKRRER